MGLQYQFSDCLRFTLTRDRYHAFSTLSIHLLTEQTVFLPCEILFSLNGQTLMHGIVYKADHVYEKGIRTMRIQARSYSAVLTKNQLEPGLYTHVLLKSLMATYDLPNITYDSDVPEITYLYVKENAVMWDTLTAYNYKLNHGFPYIRLTNLLSMTPQTGSTPVVLPEADFLQTSGGSDCSEMISRIDMADMAGRYGSFTRSNPEALRRSIVKVRQILLDKQYLYDPEDALRWRIALSNRRMESKTVSYIGYCGEDLEDLVQAGDFCTARVSRIVVSGSESGIVTTDTFYFDNFCNSTALTSEISC